MKIITLIITFLSFSISALEVIEPNYSDEIKLVIVRAMPDEMDTYSLTHKNSRVMDLSCKRKLSIGNEKKSYIRYRNFYNRVVADFKLDHHACKHLASFIEAVHYGIDENTPLLITLNRRKLNVVQITYPNLDIYPDDGDVMDLFKKPPVIIKMPRKPYVEQTPNELALQ